MRKSRIMPGLSRLLAAGAPTAFFRDAINHLEGIKSRCRAQSGSNHMANTAQARKRARQAETTRQRNASQKSALRTAIKKVKKAIATGDKAAAAATFHESQAVIDRIADKRIVHKNLASRTKSRLAQAIKALA
jgi:small subunit ribosomal protein S20